MLKIVPIPAFNDNYIWLIHNKQQAFVVDPGDASPVLAFLEKEKLSLVGILVTHWHADHIGGIKKLNDNYSDIEVIGPKSERIPNINRCVNDGDIVDILGTSLSILSVPGHTMEHIAFFGADIKAVFCGDTLFAGGCGRMFEGTADIFLASLQKLSQLPGHTGVYCAHEYTLANLEFAIEVEPENADLHNRLIECQNLRKNKQITLPSSVSLELDTNPFLRTSQESVITQALNQGASSSSAVDVFACLREWKNNF